LAAEDVGETGWVMDFAALKDECARVHNRLDHRFLNTIEGLERPTLENIARYIHAVLSQNITDLYAVEVARPSLKERVKFCPVPGR
jgi:6-pyruvoyltetrahydropterin/6-carboxytetrahydropterin synthase